VKQIILEGVSGVGKSTVQDQLSDSLGHQAIIIHRSTPTLYVYGTIYNATLDIPAYNKYEHYLQLAAPTLLVWLRCSPKESIMRKARLMDFNIREDGEEGFRFADLLYREYITEIGKFKETCEIDTERCTIANTVDYILRRLESV
jgi:thymidylate kinase